MIRILEHDGYVARIDRNDDGSFHGRVTNIYPDVVTFEGRDELELATDFAEQLRFYFDLCKKDGKPPNRPRT